MGIAHFILQKKGGSGKSFVACLWAQFLLAENYKVISIDTDPANSSFADFKDLSVTKINLLDGTEDINPRSFDSLMDLIFSLQPSEQAVIDTGSSCYVPLVAYLKNNDSFNVIQDSGHGIYLHIPLTGGPDIVHTFGCAAELAKNFPKTHKILWINRYHGELAINDKDYTKFQEYPLIQRTGLESTMHIPQKQAATFGRDLETLLSKKILFQDVNQSLLPVMVRQRLLIFWRELVEELRANNPLASPDYEGEESEDLEGNFGLSEELDSLIGEIHE
ncbi:MAG: conjugal transfer protein TraL [Deltaproteobacteria bacterium]|jgi:hypothetical protein|nr:conjugal transfer protein TraL [Deltaproteobacteria bacterium]